MPKATLIIYMISLAFSPAALGTDQEPELAKPVPKLERYVSNGCSVPDMFVSRAYISCCTHHDLAYWAGGNLEDKRKADAALVNCILSKDASKFTAGLWQVMLANFGSQRWGARWTPRRGNTPLSEQEWAEVERLSGDLKSEVPIVRSYKKSNTCTKELLEKLNSNTTLRTPPPITCYDLINTSGFLKKYAKLIFSEECNIGYFVYQFERTDTSTLKNETLTGYGLCADKIKSDKKFEAPAQVNYLVAPPLMHNIR